MKKQEIYNKMIEISNDIIEQYRIYIEKHCKDNQNIELYSNYGMFKNNFEDDDFVINVMGINPSADKKTAKTLKDDKIENIVNYIEDNKNSLVLGFVPEELEVKYDYNISYIKKQYSIWNKNIGINNLKMFWQKFDKTFLKENYNLESIKNEANIIDKYNKKYDIKKSSIEKDKYIIFTNLVYISCPNQNNIVDALNHSEKMKKIVAELFEEQIKYYNSKLIVVANSAASRFVKNEILDKNVDAWEKIYITGESKYLEESNLYKSNKYKCYIYLTSRYFDGRPTCEFYKNLFIKEMKKTIKMIENEKNK